MASLPLSLQQRRALVDSSAYLALIDEDDENHDTAVTILQQLISGRFRQFTTNYMLAEAHALILSTLGNQKANEFLQRILDSNTVIVRANLRDEEMARSILFRYTDKLFSYTDAISFAIMSRLGISSAFSFDDDFRQYGWTILTPEFFG
jgi:uncharacterized protein